MKSRLANKNTHIQIIPGTFYIKVVECQDDVHALRYDYVVVTVHWVVIVVGVVRGVKSATAAPAIITRVAFSC